MTKIEELKKKVDEVSKFADSIGMKSGVEWALNAMYMLTEYAGTDHEDEVIGDVEDAIAKMQEFGVPI